MTARPMKAKLGIEGYIRIVAAIKNKPRTREELELMHLGQKTALIPMLGQLHVRGFLHIESWECRPARHPMARYAYGPGEDAEYPTLRDNGRPRRIPKRAGQFPVKPARTELLAFMQLLEALSEPCFVLDLCEVTGLHINSVRKALRCLEKCRMARVIDWQRRSHDSSISAIWKQGSAPSVKRKPLTKDERKKRRVVIQQQYRGRIRLQQMLTRFAGTDCRSAAQGE